MMKHRPWREKFQDAGRGVLLSVREQSSFRVHLTAALLVIVAAALLRCDPLEWALLILSMGTVIAAEIFNSSLETLFHALDEGTKQRMTGCLDRAAGAVLVTAIMASLVGIMVLGRKLLQML